MRERSEAPIIQYSQLMLEQEEAELLKYTSEQLQELKGLQDKGPVNMPVDAAFNMKSVHPWEIEPLYNSQQHGIYHVHPELVQEDEDGDEKCSCMSHMLEIT